jgi:hypothetical protein
MTSTVSVIVPHVFPFPSYPYDIHGPCAAETCRSNEQRMHIVSAYTVINLIFTKRFNMYEDNNETIQRLKYELVFVFLAYNFHIKQFCYNLLLCFAIENTCFIRWIQNLYQISVLLC